MASIATTFDAATGKLMWQGRLGVAMREGFSASPVGVDGKVFFTNDEGETFVLKAGPTFELLRREPLERPGAGLARTRGRPLVLPHGSGTARHRTITGLGLQQAEAVGPKPVLSHIGASRHAANPAEAPLGYRTVDQDGRSLDSLPENGAQSLDSPRLG